MKITHPMRRRASFWLLVTLLLSQILGLAVAPQSAQAAISAEPSEEIVYLGEDGTIRVWDHEGNPAIIGNPTVGFISPTSGWAQIALGDFNNDTDLEIVALRQNGDNWAIGVYDPVVARGATHPDQKFNGIPWDTLYLSPDTPGFANFILAGNFDDGIPGDEILVGWRDAGNRYYIRVLKAAALDASNNPTGRTWVEHLTRDFSEHYTDAAGGQLTNDGPDEVVLLDHGDQKAGRESKMDVFRLDLGFERFDGKKSDNDSYQHVAVGQIIQGGREEVAVALTASRPDKASLIIYKMDELGGVYELASDGDWQWAFAPQPEFVFLADIFGNADKEVFFLRKYPAGQDGPRLIMRDDWGDDRNRFDDKNAFEDSLGDVGDDNGFRVGYGGDTDGDGKDEVLIMRDDRIWVYKTPDASSTTSRRASIIELPIRTNKKSILTGDLDKIGFIEGPMFGINVSRIETSIPVGTVSGNFPIEVKNLTTANAVTFNVVVVPNTPINPNKPWIKVTPSTATTTAIVNVSFDAGDLAIGVHTATLRLEGAGVLNSGLTIDVELTVEAATITVNPETALFVNRLCTVDPQPLLQKTVRVGGTPFLNYRAAVMGLPDEAAAASVAELAAIADRVAARAELSSSGEIILYDDQGNARTIPTGIPAGLPSGGDVSASAVLSTAWPIDPTVDWITSLSSDVTSVPSIITIQVDPNVLGTNYGRADALLVLVADSRAGSPPDNLFAVPIIIKCPTITLMLPQALNLGTTLAE